MALLATGLGAKVNALQSNAPTITMVEVRPDRTVRIEWSQPAAVASYEIGVRTGGVGAWTIVSTTSAPAVEEPARRIVAPSANWPATAGVAYEFAVRSTGAWSDPAPVTISTTLRQLNSTDASSSQLDLGWTPVPAGEPFVRYEIFVSPANARIGDCLLTSLTSQSAQTTTATTTGSPCGGDSLAAATDYTVAIRAVRNATPLVVDQLSVTTGVTLGGQALPAELFHTASVGDRWQIVDQNDQPVQWHGINLRRGELTSFAFNSAEFTSMRNQGFDSVRIAMDWDSFELAPGVFHAASFAALDRAVGWAEQAGVNVILDPFHLAEAPSWNIPAWAWAMTNDGVQDSAALLDVLRQNGVDYLRYVTQRYRARSHVIAIDVLNEPREPVSGSLDTRNGVLMELYRDLIATIRDLEPDRLLVLEPYYGSATITASRLAEVNPSGDNLIWSVHDYYAGREGTSTDDGYSSSGYPLRGSAPDGTAYRTESYSGTGCYPSGPSATQCTNDTSRGLVLRPSMAVHIGEQYAAAQAAAMPLYVGEFGIPHEGGGFPGWSGGPEFLTDKIATYERLGVSRALWAWRDDIDPSYGIYSRATQSWHDWTPFATGAASVPVGQSGDVNCNGGRDVIDALIIAQFSVGIRTASTCPLGDSSAQINESEGDFNGDDSVNVLDALLIAQCDAGIINGFC